jgi:hypothetical protein
MSRLELLPQVARKEIWRYLLLCSRVREPPNRFLAEHYAFQVNVLRLNRAIKADSSAILHGENTFVKVTWFFVQAYESMINYELAFFKLAKDVMFNLQIAEIKIGFNNFRQPMAAEQPQTCVILLNDVPKLTRLLRIVDIANFMSYTFDIKLRKAPDLATQEKLLLPFEQVRGMAIIQEVSITGQVNTALVKRVIQAMIQRVAWLRGGAWEIHELCVSIKRIGDLAFSLGNADMTCTKYIDALEFHEHAIQTNSMIQIVDNEPYHQAISRLHNTIHVDMALLAISDITEKEEGKRHFEMVPKSTHYMDTAEEINKKTMVEVFPVTSVARFYHILGVAELGLNHPNKAAKAFVKAYNIIKSPDIKAGHDAAIA